VVLTTKLTLAQADAAQTPAASTPQLFVPVVANQSAALCRFGVNLSIRNIDPLPLRVGWYVDYGATPNAVEPGAVEYFPMIHLLQSGPDDYYFWTRVKSEPTTPEQLTALVAKHPARHWFIANEPDRREWQDDIEPEVYAVAYHDLYRLIKAADPTASVIAGSIVQATPLRLEYLDLVLATYRKRYGVPLPTDAWAIHNFILNEASEAFYNDVCTSWGADIPPGIDAKEGLRIGLNDNDDFGIFVEQIVRFRQWMADRGYRGWPLYLSEYGVLFPAELDVCGQQLRYPPARVNAFMNKSFDYVLGATDPNLGDPTDGQRLIQRLSWYSVDDTNYNGNLFEDSSGSGTLALTEMGRNYAAYTARVPLEVDLAPMTLDVLPAYPFSGGDPVTLTLQATIANSGNGAAGSMSGVRFYDGDPAAGGRAIGADQIVTLPGCGTDMRVSVQWPNVAPGEYTVFVQMDPDRHVVESDEQNNVFSRNFKFATDRLYLPAQSRASAGAYAARLWRLVNRER
jgi:hypothetical protein